MPKMRTHKGVQSRFHITGSGKLMRTKGGKSHLRLKKPKRIKRLYAETIMVSASDKNRIRRLLPYGLK